MRSWCSGECGRLRLVLPEAAVAEVRWNLAAKLPESAPLFEEFSALFRRRFTARQRTMANAVNADAARAAYVLFERTWTKRCPGVSASLREGGEELLTFFTYPKAQWKTLRATNTIERLHEEFRRRVKTQGSLPSEDAALVLLFSLVVSGQIKLRRVDGWWKMATVLSQHTAVAA